MRRTLLFVGLLLWPVLACSTEKPPYRLAAGVNIGGAQVDWRLNNRWMVEARGQVASGNDHVESTVFGLRGYRFFSRAKPRFFTGLELDQVRSKQTTTPYRASGIAAGLFGGLEFRLIPHTFLMVDAGPYLISLKEARTGYNGGSLDFVANASLVVGF